YAATSGGGHAAGSIVWFRARFDGTAQTWTFYESTDDTNDDTAVNWGSNIGEIATVEESSQDTAANVTVGGIDQTGQEISGVIYRAVLYNDTTKVHGFDASKYVSGTRLPDQVSVLPDPDDFSAWDLYASTGSDPTVTVNAINDPEGNLTADKLIPAAATAVFGVMPASTTGMAVGRFSVYAKAGEFDKIGLRESVSYGQYASFDLDAGTVIEYADASSGTVSDVTIESAGDGWYKCSATFGGAAGIIRIHILNNSYTTGNPQASTLTGNGSDGVYLWRGEQSPLWTLNNDVFIQNTGRDVVCTPTGNNAGLETTVGQDIATPYTAFYVARSHAIGTTQSLGSARADSSKRSYLYIDSSADDRYRLFGGANLITSGSATTDPRLITIQNNGGVTSKLTVSGLSSATGTMGTDPWDFASIFLDYDGTNALDGWISQVIAFNRALTAPDIAKIQRKLEELV
ncbi:hypothetical protein OAA60_00605, partial [Porticoccaceae bacterium]|nr:hypothetical protein [Porticoccaceae bacterium]